MLMSRRPKKRCAVCGQNIVLYPLVDPGDPPHRYQACTAAHPTRLHHRMVTLAKSSPSRSAPRPSQKENATVMLALQLLFILASESMDHHDSEDHGWWEHRSRRRLSFGRL